MATRKTQHPQHPQQPQQHIHTGAMVEWNYHGPFHHLGNDGYGGREPVTCRVDAEYSPGSWSPQGRAWHVTIVSGPRDGYQFVALETDLTRIGTSSRTSSSKQEGN